MADDIDGLTDAALLRRAATDAHAFRVVYERHAESIFGYFRRRGVDHHTSLDLTAETFAEAWLCRSRFVDMSTGSAAPWLFGIARHSLSHAARRRAVATAAHERLAIRAEERPFDLETECLFEQIDGFDPSLLRGLAALPEDSRLAVEARVVHGESYEMIAASLNCTPLAARMRVSRALTSLRGDTSIGMTGETA